MASNGLGDHITYFIKVSEDIEPQGQTTNYTTPYNFKMDSPKTMAYKRQIQ